MYLPTCQWRTGRQNGTRKTQDQEETNIMKAFHQNQSYLFVIYMSHNVPAGFIRPLSNTLCNSFLIVNIISQFAEYFPSYSVIPFQRSQVVHSHHKHSSFSLHCFFLYSTNVSSPLQYTYIHIKPSLAYTGRYRK